MNAPLFRSEIIEAKRERLAGTVVVSTPPGSRIYVSLVLAVALVIVLILVFGQYPNRTTARGIVAYDTGLARIHPNVPGEISEIYVREGARVEAGAPLIKLSLQQGQTGLSPQMKQLELQDMELLRQQEVAVSLAAIEVRSLTAQRAAIAATTASLRRQRALAAEQVTLATNANARAKDLASQGAGTQRQVEESRGVLLARKAELENLNERTASQDQLMGRMEADILKARLDGMRRQAELAAQRADLGQARAALAQSGSVTLTAPVAGEVVEVATNIGQRARTDTALATIVPKGSRLEVWLYADSQAVGLIRPGQKLRLLFDAFPNQRYGSGSGEVLAVSRIALDPGAVDPKLGIQSPVFRIRASIDELPPRLKGVSVQLRPGSTISANLILQQRSLWEALFNPIASAVSQ